MNIELVTATRTRSFIFRETTEKQERRVFLSCLAIALFAVLLSILCSGVQAQDIYTKSNLPVVGVQYQRHYAQPLGVDPQPGGLAQIWDFSKLEAIAGVVDSVRMLAPKDVKGTIPPGSNVVVVYSKNNRRIFYNTTKGTLNYLGEENSEGPLMLGRDPFEIEPIPIKLNETITRSFDATVSFKLQPDLVVHRTDTVTFTPDGNGTLLLPPPFPNIPNVIRVRWTETFVDTVLRKDVPLYTARTQLTRYVWYGAANPVEYLCINHGDVSFEKVSEDPPVDSLINEVTYIFREPTVSEISSEEYQSLNIEPNPATTVVRLRGVLTTAQQIGLSVFSVLGEEVATMTCNAEAGEFSVSLDTRSLATGGYIVRVNIDGTIVVCMLKIVR